MAASGQFLVAAVITATARTGVGAGGTPQVSAILVPAGTPGLTVEPAYHKLGWHASDTHGLTNGRHEGLNNKIRMATRRAYGFHTPEAAFALIMLACGPVTLTLPYHT